MAEAAHNIPESLKIALRAGQVVPFVGAGVSMSVKKENGDGTKSDESLFPSWKGFVEILAKALRDENKAGEAEYVLASVKIKKSKYLEAMQHAKQELGDGHWYRIFDEIFNKSKNEAHEDSLKLSGLIWKLSSNLIITTNVDRIFQWTCPNPSEYKTLDVQNVEYAQLQNEKFPKRPTVWHLHGSVDHKEKVIFTVDQYKAFYEEKDNEAKLQTLLNFLTQRTFLFIGFSLDDAYIREQLEYIHKLYKGGADSFYILLRESEIEKVDLPNYVKPIPFSDFGKPLEDLIEELARIATAGAGTGIGKLSDEITDPSEEMKPDEKKSFFNVPYNPKGAEFVGRVGKIDEIWDLLNQDGCASIGQAVSVKGFGGLGKTQLAVEYAHAKRDEYKNGVFWLVADDNIDNQLLPIADRQKWINQADKSVNQFDVAKNKFLALSECLIVFDNVENSDDIKDYLPPINSRTHILITSREKQPVFRQIDLDLLKPDEARELLLKISKREPQNEPEKENLEKILETLGGIPLAIELVGGYLAEHETITFAKYYQFLNEVPLDQLEREFPEGSFTDHDRSIIQTLRISEKTIKEKPLMVEILKVLAWSGSSSMGTSLLQTLVEAENDFEFETALGDAHKLRLLKKDEDAERYTIHRLLAKVIRHEQTLKNNSEWHQKIIGNLEKWFDKHKEEFKYLAEFEAEIEHLNEWQTHTIKYFPKQAAWLIVLESYPLQQRANYQKSLQLLEKSLDLYESKKVNHKELLATIQNDLGLVYGWLGDYQKALKYQEKALAINKELLDEKHPSTATFYSNAGLTYGELGDYRKALEYQKKALVIRKEISGEKHPDTATSYNNVGGTYGELGDHRKALEYKEKALDISKELFGEKHPDTATSYNNVGGTYGELGDHQKALEYQEKGLEIHQELLGKQHPNSIILAKNLTHTYLKLGDTEKAGRKAAEFFSSVPQNHRDWKWFEEISRLYRKNKKRHNKRR